MRDWRLSLVAFLVALALLPGSFEILESTSHLVSEGHLAHASSHEDRHEPAGPEHGCTPTLHLCGCHASLASETPENPLVIRLRATGSFGFLASDRQRTGFQPSIDHPPQA